jgi:hypothetical protein
LGNEPENITDKPSHVVVFHQPGVFAAWPANGGLWTWDNGKEALVGFCTGGFKEQAGHNIVEPYTNLVARTRDGGITWKYEQPAGYAQAGSKFAGLAAPDWKQLTNEPVLSNGWWFVPVATTPGTARYFKLQTP